jgi:hypothetical protein
VLGNIVCQLCERAGVLRWVWVVWELCRRWVSLWGVIPCVVLALLGIGRSLRLHFCHFPVILVQFLRAIFSSAKVLPKFCQNSAKILPKFCQICQIPAKKRVRLRSVLVAFAKRQRSNMDLYPLADFRDCLLERVWVG